MGQNVGAHAHLGLAAAGKNGVVFDGLQDLVQLVTDENGDDGGRRLVAAQTVVIACRGDGDAQDFLILVHRCNNCQQENQELQVFRRRPAGVEQVLACIRADGPVVVLAGAVDPLEGLLVQ